MPSKKLKELTLRELLQKINKYRKRLQILELALDERKLQDGEVDEEQEFQDNCKEEEEEEEIKYRGSCDEEQSIFVDDKLYGYEKDSFIASSDDEANFSSDNHSPYGIVIDSD